MAAFPQVPDAQIAALAEFVDEMSDAGAVAASPAPPFVIEEQRYHSGYHHFFTETGLLGPTPWSRLVAYDLNVGEILWQAPYGDVPELAARGITGTSP